jgi:GDP-4-dehydro-6-deoxy-D-mannose reductase
VRALITGGAGFVGRILSRQLTMAGDAVYEYDVSEGDDVLDADRVADTVRSFEPDQVFHLAAISWPGESLADPGHTVDVNVRGTLNVLEAMRVTGSRARLLIAGTSEEYGYGERAGTNEITERTACAPTTVYGCSKLAATAMGQVYAQRYGLQVYGTRAWNHTGPGRQTVNAESAFARRIVAVERGQADHVPHGDLLAVRNWTDARDVVRAYRLLLDPATGAAPGIYNVCSDENTVMARILGDLIRLSRDPGMETREDPSLVFPAPWGLWPEPSAAKLHAATGWAPEIPLEQTLSELLDYWRNR